MTAGIPTDKIVRLRPGARLFGPPLAYQGRGRYPVHEAKFIFTHPPTRGQAAVDLDMQNPDSGKVRFHILNDRHIQNAASCLFRVAYVERLEGKDSCHLILEC